ncbi:MULTISPECIES: bifunctional 4-hydroxy-2-oxoglutarate aldolase/2-dehydro-3-deoxy-phosphogluconate aldolase [Clostridium]|jgi:2-dehydro-3-deoxyphosphogluconate aldolase/(4S)-4-hydroxy-2-oxoglutarate aldolase|uniref:2-dehydro-3-deoxy-phosphogluconate aldolase n=1 Tax=Clostridium lapidicellarium TaxID=3240931 RepID=A0ABV4E0Q7_9CLOT
MNSLADKIRKIGIIPVVKINDAKNSIPLVKALKEGGLDSVEITFRSPAAQNAIENVHREFPEFIVGAGTVITVRQVEEAVEAGASFIISPGYIDEVVDYCLGKNIFVIPGCSSASEVAKAVNKGLKIVKFFPAEASGGIKTLKAFSGPYPDVKFIPTGGINEENLSRYLNLKNVIACGGTWMVKDFLVEEKKFDQIEEITKRAVDKMLDYKVVHIGINAVDSKEARDICSLFENMFHFKSSENNNSIFAGADVEVMKKPFYGKKGHIAVAVNDVEKAVYQLEKINVKFIEDSIKYNEFKEPAVVYLKDEIGGFAVHLVKRG